MNDADRKAAEQQYSISAFDYASNPIGSRDWTLYWNGWQAACEWRDSQCEPLYLVAQRNPFFAELWQSIGNDTKIVAHVYGKNQSEVDKRVKMLNYLTPTAQINQQLVEALMLVLPLAKGYAENNNVGSNQEYCNIAEAALAATQMRGDA